MKALIFKVYVTFSMGCKSFGTVCAYVIKRIAQDDSE